MTSLIFGSVYLGHQAFHRHRHEKQRRRNYERWEGLRDDYDDQKRITRETRSLEIQRTGLPPYDEGPRDILTQRDLQEAGNARTSWRPDERIGWEKEASHSSMPVSPTPAATQPTPREPTITPSTYWSSRGELRPQKTGATWDEGLPTPLRVSRRSYDDYEHGRGESSLSRSDSLQHPRTSNRTSSLSSSSSYREQSPSPVFGFPAPPPQSQTTMGSAGGYSVELIASHVPGGRMAELIERGY